MTIVHPPAISASRLVSYGALAFPLAFAGIPIYLHAPELYASEFGISLATLGTVLLALRLVDAVQDPLIGRYSDYYHHWRRPIIVAGLVFLAIGFWMIFHPPAGLKILWFATSVFICTTGFSIVSINFQTLGGLWQVSEKERTQVTGWREAIGLIGLLFAAIVPSLLGSTSDPVSAFHILSMIFVPILISATWLLFRWWKEAENELWSGGPPQIGWLEAWASSWRRRFLGIYFLNALASAIPAVLVVFFVKDRLQLSDNLGLFLLLYFLSGAMAMPMWQWVSSSQGKFHCWIFSMFLAIVTFISVSLLGVGDLAAYSVICIMSGIALGADLAIPPAILADHIAQENSQASATSYFATMTFLSKSALALATGLALPLLGFLGYQPGQYVSGETGLYLSLMYGLLPCVLKLVVVVWLLRSLSRLTQSATNKTTN